MSEVAVRMVQPLTQVELDLLDHVTIWSGIVGVVCFLIVLFTAIYVSVKTLMPGRNLILFSFIFLICFIGYEQHMGGDLEWVFGPIANLYKVIIYCSILVIFSVGYFKASRYFIRDKHH